MSQITPPAMTAIEAQVGAVYHLLTLPGNRKFVHSMLIDGKPYRITVEELHSDEIAEALKTPLEEVPHDN